MQPFPIWLLPTLYRPRSINRSPPPSLHLSPSALRKTRLLLSTIPIRLLPPYHRAFHPLPVTGSSPSSSSSSLPHPTTVRCLPPHPPAHGRSLSLALSPFPRWPLRPRKASCFCHGIVAIDSPALETCFSSDISWLSLASPLGWNNEDF